MNTRYHELFLGQQKSQQESLLHPAGSVQEKEEYCFWRKCAFLRGPNFLFWQKVKFVSRHLDKSAGNAEIAVTTQEMALLAISIIS